MIPNDDFTAEVEGIQEINPLSKDETRNKIYAKAGDDRSILGHTNDMTWWLFNTVQLLVNAISKAKDIGDIKDELASAQAVIRDIDTKKDSTINLKGEKQIIQKFIESNHDIAQVLKEQNKLCEVKNNA